MKALKNLVAVLALSLPLATFAQEAAKPAEPPKVEAPKPADPPKISVTPYGIASLALYMNDGVFANQDYANYALLEKEGAMVLSARQSRVGVNAAVPMENLIGATLTGKIEFDFMGAGGSSFTNANMRLRHAFVNAAIAAGPGKFVILMGQTDGLFNALHPESTSYLANPLFQQAGNLHRRTGQIRLGYDFAGDAFGLKLDAALLNPTDATNTTPPGATAADAAFNSGNRSGMGDIEARLGFTLKPIAGIGGTLGASYHTNTRTYGTLGGTTTDVTATGFGVDADFAITEYLGLRGEYFSGEGMDDEYAGIASVSVNTTTNKAVKSDGYWAQAIIKPIPAIWLLAGVGNETVDDANYPAPNPGATPPTNVTSKLQNDMMHFGLLINMNKAWRVGLEYLSTESKARAATVADPAATSKLTASQLSLSTQLRF